jgi:hypothetical protein
MMNMQHLTSFLKGMGDIDWFLHAGEPFYGARVVESIQAGWDREGRRMFDLWEQQIRALESRALETLNDQAIDEIFNAVSDSIHGSLYEGLGSFLARRYSETNDEESRAQRTYDEGVIPEIMESVKRDVCWKGVEYVLQVHGFFGKLLEMYRRGRWVCSWDGEYPHG